MTPTSTTDPAQSCEACGRPVLVMGRMTKFYQPLTQDDGPRCQVCGGGREPEIKDQETTRFPLGLE
jgi:DNA-directed RNA polymerase subunit RPC12/RpoP